MKRKILVSVIMVAGLFLAAVTSGDLMAQSVAKKTEIAKTKKYYCPHHPDQVSDKPGKCAVCGMDLVEMTDKVKDQDMKTMKMDKDKMKMDKDKMKGDMNKMDKSKKMKEDSQKMKMDMKEMKKDTTKMMEKKM